MATFMTELDDAGEVLFLMEAETTGAFAKSSLGVKPNPLKCFKQTVGAIGMMAEQLANGVGSKVSGTGVDAEVTFGLKIDSAGMVMISQNLGCQFNCTLRFKG
jgi:hypothetical protein